MISNLIKLTSQTIISSNYYEHTYYLISDCEKYVYTYTFDMSNIDKNN